MQEKTANRQITVCKRIAAFACCVVVVSIVSHGCKKVAVDALTSSDYPAMEFAPQNIPADNCEEQGLYASDCSGFVAGGAGEAKNVILMIGDGMGFSQVFAGRVFINGPQTPLAWELFPHRGASTTCSVGKITDSAAAGTALSTGNKTQNGAISMQLEPEQRNLENIVDIIHDQKAVGIVTTANVWDATPAAFSAHVPSRDMNKEIACEMVAKTKPEIIMGGGAAAFRIKDACESTSENEEAVEVAKKAGYAIVYTAAQLHKIDSEATTRLLGLFSSKSLDFEVDRKKDSTEPHLSEMTEIALDIIENDPRGFFLMVEGARIDHASHIMNEKRLAGEMAEFNKAIQFVLDWARDRPDTLVIITADHETGSSGVIPGDYKKGDIIKMSWKPAAPLYASHSDQRVPIFGKGPNAAAIGDHIDNTATFCIIKNAFGEPPEKTAVR